VIEPDTGRIERVVAIHDVGKAINPLLCEGRSRAVHMGLGYAMTEEFLSDERGFPTKTTLKSLGILRPKDIPDRGAPGRGAPTTGPHGVKGVGEIGLVPIGAVAAAYQIDGEWRTTLPMGPPTRTPTATPAEPVDA
jgi:xanthine dehydrogenase molybdenum-binding subunit